jgi:hypothetical protein
VKVVLFHMNKAVWDAERGVCVESAVRRAAGGEAIFTRSLYSTKFSYFVCGSPARDTKRTGRHENDFTTHG